LHKWEFDLQINVLFSEKENRQIDFVWLRCVYLKNTLKEENIFCKKTIEIPKQKCNKIFLAAANRSSILLCATIFKNRNI
jgi:hypothetical protein